MRILVAVATPALCGASARCNVRRSSHCCPHLCRPIDALLVRVGRGGLCKDLGAGVGFGDGVVQGGGGGVGFGGVSNLNSLTEEPSWEKCVRSIP